MDPSIGPVSGRKGSWTAHEDSKLKGAVETHGNKKWGAIATLVPGRAETQRWNRWKDVLGPNIGTVSGRKGKWIAVEDSWLMEAVRTHGGKKWHRFRVERKSSRDRWNHSLDPSIGAVSGGND